jgi:hypothetical protein
MHVRTARKSHAHEGASGAQHVCTGLALNLQQDMKAAGERNLLVHNRSPGKYGPHIEAGAQA